MESDKCKGVLVFLDDKYATSYATLMELMHSQFGCQDALYNFVSKPVVPINLVKALSVIDDESDTGLGKDSYPNGEKKIKNIKASEEAKAKVEMISNNYKGTLEKLFTILPKTINTAITQLHYFQVLNSLLFLRLLLLHNMCLHLSELLRYTFRLPLLNMYILLFRILP